MKRYLVFAYPDYYPCGGMGDFLQDFANKQDAINLAQAQEQEGLNAQVYDTVQKKHIEY